MAWTGLVCCKAEGSHASRLVTNDIRLTMYLIQGKPHLEENQLVFRDVRMGNSPLRIQPLTVSTGVYSDRYATVFEGRLCSTNYIISIQMLCLTT